MVNSSFFTDGTPYSEDDVVTTEYPAPTTPSQAPSGFYPDGQPYTQADEAAAEHSADLAAASAAAALASQGAAASSAAAAGSASAAAIAAAAGTATPLVDGTAAVGTSAKWAHEDHVHPTDTSRASVAALTAAVTPKADKTYVDTQDALKADKTYVDTQDAAKANKTYVDAQDALKAPLASPIFTGTPAAATAANGTNTTQLATTAFVLANAGPSNVLRYDIAQVLNSTQLSQVRANAGILKKNYILNGGMMVSQENGATPGTASGFYPVDQWSIVVGGTAGTYSVAQVASPTPGGSSNRIRLTVTAADAAMGAGDVVLLNQNIEGYRVADLRSGSSAAKTVTVQFGCKGPAGTYSVAIRNSGATRAYVGEITIAAGEANTDVVKSITIPLDQAGTWFADNNIGLSVSIALMGGSTFQAPLNTWSAGNLVATANQFNFMGTAGNVFELFDVGIYEGSAAPPFQLPDYPTELTLCQRYFQLFSPLILSFPFPSAGQLAYHLVSFDVVMRAAPTVTTKAAPGLANLSAFTVGVQVGVDRVRCDLTSTNAGTGYAQGGVYLLNARL
jgi:hypothetical protein